MNETIQIIDNIIDDITDFVFNVVLYVLTHDIDEIIDDVIDFVEGIVNETIQKIENVIDVVVEIVDDIVDKVDSFIDEIIDEIRDYIIGLRNITEISAKAVVKGYDVIVTGTVNKGATGYVLIGNGLDYTVVSVKDGKFSYTKAFKPGTYKINVVYLGNLYYNLNSTTVSATVKAPTTVSASNVNVVYGNSKNIIVTLKDAKGNLVAGETVKVKLNGKTYSGITNTNGQASIAVPTLAPNTYAASITFAGDSNYDSSVSASKVVVTKAVPKLVAPKKTYKVGTKTKKCTVSLKTNKNKPMKGKLVTLKVNKKTYKVKTNAKGKATFKITNLNKKGTFTSVVKFAGNNYYTAKTVKQKIVVK